MTFLDITRRAWRSLVQAKARTFLTSLAIAVGAFTLTLSLAAGEGARQYANKLIETNTDKSELFVSKDTRLFGADPAGFSQPQEYDENATHGGGLGISFKQLTMKDLDKLKNVEGVESVRPQYRVTPQFIKSGQNDKKYSANIEAYTPGMKPQLAAGKLPAEGDIPNGTVVLPDSFVSLLGFKNEADAVNKNISVQLSHPVDVTPEQIQEVLVTEGIEGIQNLQQTETTTRNFKIIGVSEKSATAIDNSPRLMTSLSDTKDMAEFSTKGTDNYQKYLIANVRVSGGEDKAKLEAVQSKLKDMGYGVQSAEDAQQLIFQVVNILQGIVIGFGILALIASVFGIINTQYISVLERTSQIGLMKALGMRRFDVGTLFRLEAALIGLLGGVIGAGFAVVLGTLLNPWITEMLELGEGNSLLIFQVIPIVSLLIGLMLVAVLAGLMPARKASKLDPIEALRTE